MASQPAAEGKGQATLRCSVLARARRDMVQRDKRREQMMAWISHDTVAITHQSDEQKPLCR